MASTSPTRIDDDLYASAKATGQVMSRSAAQQIAHWARIGREVEAGSASHRDIVGVLAGKDSYDALATSDQAVVRAAWAERMTELRTQLDLAQDFLEADVAFSELDDQGNVVRHAAGTSGLSTPDKAPPRRTSSKARATSR